jgi:hypothetical protein
MIIQWWKKNSQIDPIALKKIDRYILYIANICERGMC